MKVVTGFTIGVMVLLTVLLPVRSASSSPPGMGAFLVFSAHEQVHSAAEVVTLLTQYREALADAVAGHFPTFPIQPPEGNLSEVGAASVEFLFDHAVCRPRQEAGTFSKVAFPDGAGDVFPVEVPMIVKGSSYTQGNGKVIVRMDKNIKERSFVIDKDGHQGPVTEIVEEIPVPATTLYLYVNEKGDIYTQH